MERTTITVSDEVWRYLNQRKGRGESFDDVLRDELGINEPSESAQSESETQSWPETHPTQEIDFPQNKNRDECLKAIDAAVAYVREHGEASMREIVMDVMPEQPLGYDVPQLEPGDRYRGSWWRKIVRPGLEASPAVEFDESSRRWRRTD